MVCTCERLMVPFAHVPGSGGESCGEAGPESGAVVDCLFSLRLLEKAQQLLRVCRLFLFKESKLPRLLRSLKGCRKAHSPSQDFLSSFFWILPSGRVYPGPQGWKKTSHDAAWSCLGPFWPFQRVWGWYYFQSNVKTAFTIYRTAQWMFPEAAWLEVMSFLWWLNEHLQFLHSPEVSELVGVVMPVCPSVRALCQISVCCQQSPIFPGISPVPTRVLLNCCFHIPIVSLLWCRNTKCNFEYFVRHFTKKGKTYFCFSMLFLLENFPNWQSHLRLSVLKSSILF